jgi:hypothetical protein
MTPAAEFDFFMSTTFPCLVYMVNLFVVFQTSHPLDIVLNSLAMEFITSLDDEFKERTFKAYPELMVPLAKARGVEKEVCAHVRCRGVLCRV